MIVTQNNGQEILSCSYWGTHAEQEGYYYLSPNAGCFRLLAPGKSDRQIAEMQSARTVIISRGPWPDQNRPDALEVLFDDDTQSPFALHLTIEQCERLPAATDAGREFVFALWTGPTPQKVFTRPCFYRLTPKIPCLKPWSTGHP